MKESARFFKALADPTRLRIVNLLLRTPLCVCEMEAILKLPQPLISRHMAYLRNCGWVEGERDAMRVVYRLRKEAGGVGQIGKALVKLLAAEPQGAEDLARLETVAVIKSGKE